MSSDALVDALVADVQGEPGALPLLSTALLELWQERDGPRLSFAVYERAGGVRGAVARLAERVYERLDSEERTRARAILVRLAGVGEGGIAVRRRLPLGELEGSAEVLSKLADGRLVSVSGDQAEVAHEALLREWPRLRAWLEEDAEGRRLHHHLAVAAREWDARGRDPGELYRGARLAAALDWCAAHEAELDDVERAFVDASRAASGRSQRRLRAVLAGVGALLVLAVLAGLVALDQRSSARDQATAADAQRLGSRALAENDLDRSLLLARQGVALDDSPQTRGSLLAALIKSPAAIGVLRGVGERLSALALSPDGRTLAAGDAAGSVFLFDTRTRRRVQAPDVHPGEWEITQLTFSPDSRHLAIAHDYGDGQAVTLLATRGQVGRLLGLYDFERLVTGMRFVDDASLDVASVPRGTGATPRTLVERFDVASGRRLLGPVTLGHQPSPLLGTPDGSRVLTRADRHLVTRDARTLQPVDRIDIGPARGERDPGAMALAPDDRTVAIGEQDGSVRFVDLRTGAVRRATGRHGGAVTGAAFTPSRDTLVTTSDDGEAIVWDVAARTRSRRCRPRQRHHGARDRARRRHAYTAGRDGAVFVWDLLGTRRLGRPFAAGGPNGTRSALSSDGRRLALGQEDGAISVVQLSKPERRRTFPVIPDGEEVTGIRFVPGSRLVVIVGPDEFTALVDTDTGHIVRRFDYRPLAGVDTAYVAPAISTDGRLLATPRHTGGSDLIEVNLWALPSGRRLAEPFRVDRQIEDLQLSPDGRLLMIALANPGLVEGGSVEAWTCAPAAGSAASPCRGSRRSRASAPTASDSWSEPPGETRVYATATFKPVTRILAGDAGRIISAAIAPNGRTLATGSETGAVQLWTSAAARRSARRYRASRPAA